MYHAVERKPLQETEYVWLYTPRLQPELAKFSILWTGPYEIIGKHNPVLYTIQSRWAQAKPLTTTVSIDRLKRYYGVPPQPGDTSETLTLADIQTHDEFAEANPEADGKPPKLSQALPVEFAPDEPDLIMQDLAQETVRLADATRKAEASQQHLDATRHRLERQESALREISAQHDDPSFAPHPARASTPVEAGVEEAEEAREGVIPPLPAGSGAAGATRGPTPSVKRRRHDTSLDKSGPEALEPDQSESFSRRLQGPITRGLRRLLKGRKKAKLESIAEEEG